MNFRSYLLLFFLAITSFNGASSMDQSSYDSKTSTITQPHDNDNWLIQPEELKVEKKSNDKLKPLSSIKKIKPWNLNKQLSNDMEDLQDDNADEGFWIENDPDDNELLAFGRLVFPNLKNRKPNLTSDEEKAKIILDYEVNKFARLLFPEEYLENPMQTQCASL